MMFNDWQDALQQITGKEIANVTLLLPIITQSIQHLTQSCCALPSPSHTLVLDGEADHACTGFQTQPLRCTAPLSHWGEPLHHTGIIPLTLFLGVIRTGILLLKTSPILFQDRSLPRKITKQSRTKKKKSWCLNYHEVHLHNYGNGRIPIELQLMSFWPHVVIFFTFWRCLCIP